MKKPDNPYAATGGKDRVLDALERITEAYVQLLDAEYAPATYPKPSDGNATVLYARQVIEVANLLNSKKVQS